MPKLLIAFASAMLLLASSGIWKANAATITNAGTLSPLTKSYTPVEEVGWRRRYSPCLSPWLLWLWLRLPVLWLCLPSLPVLRLRLQAIRLLRLRLEAGYQHRYRTWLGLRLLTRQLHEGPTKQKRRLQSQRVVRPNRQNMCQGIRAINCTSRFSD